MTAAAKRFEESGYEVNVITGEKATLKAIREAVKGLSEKGNANGVVVVALARHGSQPEGSPDAFYCPFDTKMRIAMRDGKPLLIGGKTVLEGDPETLFPLGEILTAFQSCPAGAKLLLADCCRNDPTSGRGRGVGTNLKVGDLPENTAVFLACSKGQEAYEDKAWGGGHGALFYHVLEGMNGKAAEDDGSVNANRPKLRACE